MYYRLKNISAVILIFVLLIFLCTLQCNEARRGSNRRKGPYRKGTWSQGWFSLPSSLSTDGEWYTSLFDIVKKWGPPRNKTSDPALEHPNLHLPGGVEPPQGVKLPYVLTNNASDYNTSISQMGLPPPLPPPGFLNTRDTGGAAPSYTYYINYYIPRDSNDRLSAGFALWEISKHRSHYLVYHTVKHKYFSAIVEVPNNEEFKPGETYIILPNDLKCTFLIIIDSMKIIASCTSNKRLVINIIFPNNTTANVECLHFESTCTISKQINDNDIIPVNFEMFNELDVYGLPLCKTIVRNGSLEIDHAQYRRGSPLCVYPPYKWTGGEWTTLEAEKHKEKVKQNLESVKKIQDETLRALAHSTPFGKFYDMINKNTK